MTVLRQRVREDLRVRNYSPRTQKTYVDAVAKFAQDYDKPPDQLEQEDVRRHQVHLVEEKGVSWSAFKQTVCALRFFYRTTLSRDWTIKHIPFAKLPRKLPVVLNRDEVRQLSAAAYIRRKIATLIRRHSVTTARWRSRFSRPSSA